VRLLPQSRLRWQQQSTAVRPLLVFFSYVYLFVDFLVCGAELQANRVRAHTSERLELLRLGSIAPLSRPLPPLPPQYLEIAAANFVALQVSYLVCLFVLFANFIFFVSVVSSALFCGQGVGIG
jgi:hypothetical protein